MCNEGQLRKNPAGSHRRDTQTSKPLSALAKLDQRDARRLKTTHACSLLTCSNDNRSKRLGFHYQRDLKRPYANDPKAGDQHFPSKLNQTKRKKYVSGPQPRTWLTFACLKTHRVGHLSKRRTHFPSRSLQSGGLS
jgi:hypothetical protein